MTRRVRVAVLAELGAVFVALLWVGGAAAQGSSLHEAPVSLVGPDVVTGALAQMAESQSRGNFDVTTFNGDTEGRNAARADLKTGTSVGVLELDLTGTHDRFLLPGLPAPARDDALIADVRAIERAYDRTITVERRPSQSASPNTVCGMLAAPTVALVAVLVGFIAALGLSILRGPVASSFAAGTLRFLTLAAAGALVSLAHAAAGGTREASLWLGLACLVSGSFTLAGEVIGGFRAVVFAALLLIAAPLPLAVSGDRWLLAEPWRSVSEWSLVGAAWGLATRAPERPVSVQACLVLLGTLVLSMVVILRWRIYARSVASFEAPEGAPGAMVGIATGEANSSPTHHRVSPRQVKQRLFVASTSAVTLTVLSYVSWDAFASEAAPASLPNLASTTRCLQTGTIDGVADLNRIAQLRGSPQMRGGDVGASAQLQDGRRLWMFGDTIRNPDLAAGGFVRNSMLMIEPGCLEVVVPQSNGAILPDRSDGVGYWPMSVVVFGYSGYDMVAVTAQRVRTVDASDVFGFENLGPAVALFVVPAGRTPQLIAQHDIGPDSADTTRPMWGAATALDERFLYLYGTARAPQVQLGAGFSLSVARVPVAQVADDEQWRYWSGSVWSTDPRAAAILIAERDGVSQTLSVFRQANQWFALSKRNEVLGQDVVIWTAAGPTGPFTAQPPVASIPSNAQTGELRYMPLAHPGLLPRPGTMIVSYSRNRTNLEDVVEDPRRYRPAFLRVRLPGQ